MSNRLDIASPARLLFNIRLITKISINTILTKATATQCWPKNTQDHSPLRISWLAQSVLRVELPWWYSCQPAIAINTYKNVHTIGNAILGGLQGARFSAKYHSPGLKRPPKLNTAKQIKRKTIKLGHFSLSLSDFTYRPRIVQLCIRVQDVRNADD